MKEIKNSLSGVMMSCLVQHRLFDEAGHHHLPVGHTHEDVGKATSHAFCAPSDGVYGYLTTYLSQTTDSLQTPADFARRGLILPPMLHQVAQVPSWKAWQDLRRSGRVFQSDPDGGGAALNSCADH